MKTPRSYKAVRVLDDQRIGLEARAASGDHLDVKVWLRLLACSTQIEQAIRSRLRQRFGTTLPRFDYLAQLQRHPDGLRMSALSRYMMVTGGNVTGLTDQLVADGWVERTPDPEDGRSWRVRLTPLGHTEFAAMADEHEGWLAELFADFGAAHKEALYEQLGRLRVHLAHNRADAPLAESALPPDAAATSEPATPATPATPAPRAAAAAAAGAVSPAAQPGSPAAQAVPSMAPPARVAAASKPRSKARR